MDTLQHLSLVGGKKLTHKHHISTEFRGYIPHYKDTVSITVLKMRDDGKVTMQSADIRQRNTAQGQGCLLWSSGRKETEKFIYDDRKTYDELVKRGAIDPKDGIFTRDMFVYPRTWEQATTYGRKEFKRFPEGQKYMK